MYRQLGIQKRALWSYNRLRPIHFTLTANIIGTLQVDRLQQALFLVQQRHPLLNVRIVLDQLGIPWCITDSAPIPVRLVKRHSQQQWQQEVEQELANPFDWNQAPLVRVVLLQGNEVSDLIITCDHALADGMSVVFLLRDILQAVGLPELQLSVLPQQPNYEQLVPQGFAPCYLRLKSASSNGPSPATHVERDRVVGVATLGERIFFSLVYSELECSATQIEQLQQKVVQILGDSHLVPSHTESQSIVFS